MAISLKVNGVTRSVPAEPDTPLLYVLRNDLELNGAKYGCGLAQCGACTVLVDGKAVRSCVTPIGALGNSEITTIEALGTLEKPHPLQRAFIDEQAAQCGYCTSGMIMSAKELLDRKPRPSEQEVAAALAGNLCRCGTYNRIIRAVLRAGAGEREDLTMKAPALNRREFSRRPRRHSRRLLARPAASRSARSRRVCPAACRAIAGSRPGFASTPTAARRYSRARSSSGRAFSLRSPRSRPRSSIFRSIASRWSPATPRAPRTKA